MREGFAPRIIAFENVVGLLTRAGGQDLVEVMNTFDFLGYHAGGLVIDAKAFVPQSRPRLFVIAIRKGTDVSSLQHLGGPFHTASLKRFLSAAPEKVKANWVWWKHEAPKKPAPSLESLIDWDCDDPTLLQD